MKMSSINFIIFTIFCVYDKAASGQLDLYQQIQKLNASCFPLDSCSTFVDSGSDHLWNQRKCECGAHCVRFGTCCADSIYVFEKLPIDLPKSESCQKIQYFPTPVMIVSQCDSNWKWPSNIVEKCEKNYYSSVDHLSTNLPLTNVKTLTTYKNYYCAQCNFGGDHFLYWNVVLKSKDSAELLSIMKYDKPYILKYIKYDAHSKNWMFLDKADRRRFRVTIQFVLPPYMRKMVKPCYTDLIQTCKSSRSRSLIKQYCQAHYAPVEIKTGGRTSVYKNIHCAMCNNVNTASVKVSNCIEETSRRAENVISFPHLIDVKFTKGNKVGMIEVNEPHCGINAVYDPLANTCRRLFCIPGTGRVLVNGKCVPQ